MHGNTTIARQRSGRRLLPIVLLLAGLAGSPAAVFLKENIDRPLRYFPEGRDFVITNGAEFFNRPLYCLNSAFRVDGGDKPEFSLYLPGRGGNLRLGIKTPAGVKWLNDAREIIARYRPGSLLYEIHDPLLGNRELHLAVLPLSQSKGIIVRAELQGSWMPVELVWAFGGANGMKGRRNGDIGCETKPDSEFFQLEPEQCAGNEFTIVTNTFILRTRTAMISGVASAGTKFFVADANYWAKPEELLGRGAPAPSSFRLSSATRNFISTSRSASPCNKSAASKDGKTWTTWQKLLPLPSNAGARSLIAWRSRRPIRLLIRRRQR